MVDYIELELNKFLPKVEINDWIKNNRWIHKDQINDFTNTIRAQLPIIEYSAYVESSTTSYAKKTWRYRKVANEIYADSDKSPLLFELLNIKISSTTNYEFQFDSLNSIILNEKLSGNIFLF